MAKKKPADSFVLAAAVRDVLTKQPTLSANQVIDVIRKENPKVRFNEASAKVSFSNMRRQLGIGRKRRKVRRKLPALGAGVIPKPRALNLELLQAAKNLLAVAGSSENAVAALRQVASLQVR